MICRGASFLGAIFVLSFRILLLLLPSCKYCCGDSDTKRDEDMFLETNILDLNRVDSFFNGS